MVDTDNIFLIIGDMINLKAKAVEAGIKGQEIAEHFNVTPSCVSQWLKRGRLVPTKHLREFARLLNVSVEDLLPETQPNGEP